MAEPIQFGTPDPGGKNPRQGARVLTSQGEPYQPGMFGTKEALAQSAYEGAKAFIEAEKRMTSFIDTMRRGGATYDDITDAADSMLKKEMQVLNIRKMSSAEIRRFGSDFNMSIDKLIKTPLNELTKNMDGLAVSISKAASVPATLGTILTAVPKMYDALAAASRGAGTFAVAGGGLVRGRFEPSSTEMAKIFGARGQLGLMGVRGDAQEALLQSLASTLPKEVAKEAGPEWAQAAGALSRTMGITLEQSSALISESVRMGIDAPKLKDTVNFLADEFESLPMPEVTGMFLDLWRTGKLFGDSQEQSIAMLKRYEEGLRKGTATVEGIRQTRTGAFTGTFQEMARMSYMMRQFGPQGVIQGQTPIEMVESLRNLLARDPKQFEQAYTQTISALAGRTFGVNTSTTRAIAARNMMGAGFVPQEMVRRTVMGDVAVESTGDSARKVSTEFENLKTQAVDYQAKTGELLSNLGSAVTALGDFAGVTGTTSKAMEEAGEVIMRSFGFNAFQRMMSIDANSGVKDND